MPPWASANAPRRSVIAPVKLPLTWPNSIDSISSRGTEPQSNTTNGPSLRGEWLWISSAISSLPVPVSPSISTVAVVAATSSSSVNICRILVSPPTIVPNAVCALGSGSTISSSGRNLMTVRPSFTSAPNPIEIFSNREPWMNVPLVDPQSTS